MATIASQPLWRSAQLQLLALASAATAAIVAGAERFQIPLASVALSLFVLSAVYALLALGAEAAKDFPPLKDWHRARRRASAGATRSLIRSDVIFWISLVPLAVAAVALVRLATIVAAVPDFVDRIQTGRDLAWVPVHVGLAFLITLTVTCVVLGWLVRKDGEALAHIVNWMTAIAFVLALLGMATPFVSFAARELPRAADQASSGAGGNERQFPYQGGSAGGGGAEAYASAGPSDEQMQNLAEAIRSLRAEGAATGITDAQMRMLLEAIAAHEHLNGADPGLVMTDAQVRALVDAIREAPAVQVRVDGGDVEVATVNTSNTNNVVRSAPPRWIRVRNPCTIRRAPAN